MPDAVTVATIDANWLGAENPAGGGAFMAIVLVPTVSGSNWIVLAGVQLAFPAIDCGELTIVPTAGVEFVTPTLTGVMPKRSIPTLW